MATTSNIKKTGKKPASTNNKKAPAKVTRNPLFTLYVFRGLQALKRASKSNFADYLDMVNDIFDTAVIHGYMGGLRCHTFDGKKIVEGLGNKAGDWTEKSYKKIMQAKEAVKYSLEFAKDMKVVNNSLAGVEGIENKLCKMWADCDFEINDTILTQVFHAACVFVPIVKNEMRYFNVLREAYELLEIINHIIIGISEGVAAKYADKKGHLIKFYKKHYGQKREVIYYWRDYTVTVCNMELLKRDGVKEDTVFTIDFNKSDNDTIVTTYQVEKDGKTSKNTFYFGLNDISAIQVKE